MVHGIPTADAKTTYCGRSVAEIRKGFSPSEAVTANPVGITCPPCKAAAGG